VVESRFTQCRCVFILTGVAISFVYLHASPEVNLVLMSLTSYVLSIPLFHAYLCDAYLLKV
jgi:hypothetical protein